MRSVLHALDELWDMFTIAAYQGYTRLEPEDAEIPGVSKVPTSRLKPQESNLDPGLKVREPHIYAELQALEGELWRIVRRRLGRLHTLGEGLCLRCGKPNDQPKRRYCSKCERLP